MRATHKTLRDRRLADRVKAVVLLGSGWSVVDVAEALLVDEKTVRLWSEKYRHGSETELLAKYPNAKKIHVFVDNATCYTSTWLRQKLRGMKIVLHFLPAYSPNLNLIERLWKFFKKKIRIVIKKHEASPAFVFRITG